MCQYKTDHFGKISFEDNPGYKFARVEYNGYLINFFIDDDIYNDNMDMCLKIINEYFEINVIAKKYILNNHLKKLNNCFKCRLDYFKGRIINKIFGINVNRDINYGCIEGLLKYPKSIDITMNNNNELMIIVGYILQNDCHFGVSGVMLRLCMDVKFNVLNFSHGEIMKC
jgi:hypothetical protein